MENLLPLPIRRAVCYVRRSREDEQAEQRGEDTLAAQRDMMKREVLSKFDFEYDLVEEVASGDSIRDRPAFRAVLPLMGTVYQAIAVKDLSRLGRGSYSDMGVVYDLIRDRRVCIITKDAVYDPQNASHLMMIRFSMFISREEYEMITWRMKEGKASLSRQGKWVAGAVPYGYRYDPRTRSLVIERDEAEVVRAIFSLYADTRLGFQGIAAKLRRLGVPTPRGNRCWRPAVIGRMLRKSVYIGTVVYRKTQRNRMDRGRTLRPEHERIVVPHAHEPIVDPATWAKVDERLASHRRQPAANAGHKLCELAGIVRCRDCGRALVRQHNRRTYRRSGGGVSTYANEFLWDSTCRYSVRYREVESRLMRALEEFRELDGARLALAVETAPQGGESGAPGRRMDAEQKLLEHRAAIERRLERARELLLDGTFARAEYGRIKSGCEKELEAAARELEDVRRCAAAAGARRMDAGGVCRRVASVLDAYRLLDDTESKNELLSAVFPQVLLERLPKERRGRPNAFRLHVALPVSLLRQDLHSASLRR